MAGRISACQEQELPTIPPTVLASIAAFSNPHNHVIVEPQSESSRLNTAPVDLALSSNAAGAEIDSVAFRLST